MPLLSEALKNASKAELEVICRRITPFVGGKNPPQIMTIAIDDSTLLDILKKYNIIDSSTYPFKTLNESYGTVKVVEFPITDPQTGMVKIENVIYIEPPSLETLKKQNGDSSIDIAPNTSSGFDGITALLDKKITEDYAKNIDEQIQYGYKIKTIIPQVIKNENDGSEKIILLEIDPEETERARKKEGDSTTAKYKIFQPEGPPVVPVNLNENALRVAESVTGASVIEQRQIGKSLSPTAEASSAYSSLTSPFYTSLKTFSGANAITIKVLNAFGVFDFDNFEKNIPNTWGGFNHVGKERLMGLRANLNIGTAGYFGISALIDYINGDYEEAKKNAESSMEWLYKEYVFVPRYQKIGDAIGRASNLIFPGDESYTPKGYGTSGRGKNILSSGDKEQIKKYFPKSKVADIKGPLSKDIAKEASVLIGKANKIDRVTKKTSGVIQAIGYINAYGVKPLIEDDVKQRKDDAKKFDEQENLRQLADRISTQPKVTLQTGNTITYDDGEILAKDPKTGTNVRLKLPLISELKTDNSEIDWTWIINQGLPPSQRTGYKTDLPVINVYGDKYGNIDRTWDAAKDFMYATAEQTKKVVEGTPVNMLVVDALETLSKTPKNIGFLFRKKLPELTKLGPKWFEKGSEKLIKGISGLAATAITMFLTEPTSFADATYDGMQQRELEKLNEKLKDGTIKNNEELQQILSRIKDIEDYFKRQEGYKEQSRRNRYLHPPWKDFDLSSNVNLLGEVEAAKQDYDRMKLIVDNLGKVGDKIANKSSPVPPVPLSKINQNVNFVPNAKSDSLPPWKNIDPYVNTPIMNESCFPEYVKVNTDKGTKKISELKINDNVLSFSPSGDMEIDIVSDVFKHENREIYRYFLENGSHIDITKEHPVLVDLNKFEKIGNLNVGDFLIDINQNRIKIVDVRFLEIADVFNIEVKRNNTYIAENIRVHNKLGQQYQRRLERDNALEIFQILSDNETSQQEYLKWVDEQFENVVRLVAANYSPYLVPYGYIPGTPGPKRVTLPEDPGTPTGTTPYGGPPEITPNGGFEVVTPETDPYYDSSFNSLDYQPVPSILKE